MANDDTRSIKQAAKPVRIQRRRTKGWTMPENTVYVGRPSKWGNDYTIGEISPCDDEQKPLSAEDAVGLFRHYQAYWFSDDEIAEIRGKNLACWCPLDQPCHADVLLEVANG